MTCGMTSPADPAKTRSKHAEATNKRPRGQGQARETHLRSVAQVDLDQPLDKLNPLLGILKLHRQLGKIGLHGESPPQKDVLELTLLQIPKDEPNLRWVLRTGPHQVSLLQPAGGPSLRPDHRQLLRRRRQLHLVTCFIVRGDLHHLGFTGHR